MVAAMLMFQLAQPMILDLAGYWARPGRDVKVSCRDAAVTFPQFKLLT